MLVAGGTTIGALVAGCASAIPGADDRGPEYHAWLGEEMLAAQERVRGADDATCTVVSPDIEADSDRLPEDVVDEVGPDRGTIRAGEATVEVDPADIELRIADSTRTWEVAVGSVDDLADEVSERAERRGEHGDHRLYAVPSAANPDLVAGVAVGGDSVAVVRDAPPEAALDYTRAILDTGSGDADRFVDGDEVAETLVDELGGGTYVTVNGFGGPAPRAIRVSLDGAAARYRAVRVHETADDAADDRLLDEEFLEGLRELPERREGRPRDLPDIYAVYDSVDASRSGRFVIVDGSLPTVELEPIDVTSLP